MPPGSSEFALHEISISIEGDSEMTFIVFTNLVISQQLATTNSFSFIWRTDHSDATFATHVDFYRANLGKVVTITAGDNFTFKGFVNSISHVNNGELFVEYQIMGNGLFAKLDEVEECNSFYHKSLTDIFNSLNTAQGTTLTLSPSNTSQLFYHVQYNCTTFNFYRMLAARYGEWMYYTGEELVLGTPGGDALELQNGTDVHNLHLNAAIRKASVPGVGFDQYSGEILHNTPSSSSASGLIGVSTEAGDATFGSEHTARRVSTAPTSDLLREMNTLSQQAAAASTVYLEGSTGNPLVKLGGKIRIVDRDNNSEGEYIITQVQHSASNGTNYQNHFMAVPADVQVPPYTNPLIYPVCNAQPATVVDNEDADGLDRIKVRFPWMQDTETSPWISVMVPYAGNGRGMRFIPEVDEEVMIDFVDNNAERPIMIGSFYTTANTSGVAHEGNHIKAFGTRSGRRLEINDDVGTIRISDHDGDNPGNKIQLESSDQTSLSMFSGEGSNDYSMMQLDQTRGILIALTIGGEDKYIITFNAADDKLSIESKGSIELKADKDIEINSLQNIKLNASQKVLIEGTAGVEIKGTTIKAQADATLEMKGATATIEGSATLEAKGGALASLQGAIVKIN